MKSGHLTLRKKNAFSLAGFFFANAACDHAAVCPFDPGAAPDVQAISYTAQDISKTLDRFTEGVYSVSDAFSTDERLLEILDRSYSDNPNAKKYAITYTNGALFESYSRLVKQKKIDAIYVVNRHDVLDFLDPNQTTTLLIKNFEALGMDDAQNSGSSTFTRCRRIFSAQSGTVKCGGIRWFWEAAGVGAAALGLAACGGSSSSSTAASAPASSAAASAASGSGKPYEGVVLHYAATDTKATGNEMQDIVKMVKEKTGIDIQFTIIPKADVGEVDKRLVSLQAGDELDIIYGTTAQLKVFYDAGVLSPLDEYAAAASYDAPAVFGGSIPYYDDGQMYGLPAFNDVWCTFVNTKVFENAGVEVPSAEGWTWDRKESSPLP